MTSKCIYQSKYLSSNDNKMFLTCHVKFPGLTATYRQELSDGLQCRSNSPRKLLTIGIYQQMLTLLSINNIMAVW